MLLKNQWVHDEIKEEIRKYLETNENANTTFQNLWDATKAALRGKFRVIQAFLKKQEKISSKQPNLPPEGIRKRTKPKVSRRKGIKIREEINKIEI